MSERKTLKKKVYPVLEEYYKKKKKQRINERNNEFGEDFYHVLKEM